MKFFPTTARTSANFTLSANCVTHEQASTLAHGLASSGASTENTNQQEAVNRADNILIVDDDAGVRDVLAELLRRSGYRVSCANDGEAAWEALCANSFDALVTDHAMPGLTGLDLLRRVRSGPLNAMPIILISGQMPWEETELLDLVRPGVAMEKPFSFFEFLANVRTALSFATCADVPHEIQPLTAFATEPLPGPFPILEDDGSTGLPVPALAGVR
jgi:CheY-like chemotaxis protein